MLHHETDCIREEPREEDIANSFNQREACTKWITSFRYNKSIPAEFQISIRSTNGLREAN